MFIIYHRKIILRKHSSSEFNFNSLLCAGERAPKRSAFFSPATDATSAHSPPRRSPLSPLLPRSPSPYLPTLDASCRLSGLLCSHLLCPLRRLSFLLLLPLRMRCHWRMPHPTSCRRTRKLKQVFKTYMEEHSHNQYHAHAKCDAFAQDARPNYPPSGCSVVEADVATSITQPFKCGVELFTCPDCHLEFSFERVNLPSCSHDQSCR